MTGVQTCALPISILDGVRVKEYDNELRKFNKDRSRMLYYGANKYERQIHSIIMTFPLTSVYHGPSIRLIKADLAEMKKTIPDILARIVIAVTFSNSLPVSKHEVIKRIVAETFDIKLANIFITQAYVDEREKNATIDRSVVQVFEKVVELAATFVHKNHEDILEAYNIKETQWEKFVYKAKEVLYSYNSKVKQWGSLVKRRFDSLPISVRSISMKTLDFMADLAGNIWNFVCDVNRTKHGSVMYANIVAEACFTVAIVLIIALVNCRHSDRDRNPDRDTDRDTETNTETNTEPELTIEDVVKIWD